MTAKHTPGPWRVEADGGPVMTASATVVMASDGSSLAVMPFATARIDKAQIRANATLMAAAPSLADALAALVRDLPHTHLDMCECDYCENLKAAQAALRDAGRSP